MFAKAKKVLGRTHLWHWRNVPKFPHYRDEDMPIAVWLNGAEDGGSEGERSEECDQCNLPKPVRILLIILVLFVFSAAPLIIAFAPESSLPKHHHHGNNTTHTRSKLLLALISS